MRLRISSRQSDLARIQAYQVGDALKGHLPDLQIDYLFRESLGDQNQKDPLWKMPEKGVFTEDFYQDLADGKTDLVVHSWKDLPVEEKPETFIAATLPRADQRDLLLFKKSSQRSKQKKFRIFTSSPRRAHHLETFLAEALPNGAQGVEFTSVRGNVPTRIRKLLEDPNVDGLIVAKAGLDRLLLAERDEFQPTVQSLRQALQCLDFMVLPLFQNPNAAAQGALAIEVARSRPEIIEIVRKVHCQATYEVVQREREIFSSFGGGCHQKIGVAVFRKPYGQIECLKGVTSKGEVLDQISLESDFGSIKSRWPREVEIRPYFQEVKIRIERKTRQFSDIQADLEASAYWVTRAEALPENFKTANEIVWAAGWQTWQRLAKLGHWVHGCGEGLGEELPNLKALVDQDLSWARLTHQEAPSSAQMPSIATYQMQIKEIEFEFENENFFFWKSASQFQAAISKYPELKKQFHACGPGRTYEIVCSILGNSEQVFIFLNEAHWRHECQNLKNSLSAPRK